MPFRKKKTVRDQLEDRLDDFLTQADDLRQQVSDRAPEVRDKLADRLDAGLTEFRARWPEIRDELLDRVPELTDEQYERLPNGVAERLPKQVKPKKKRFRKIAAIGLVAGAGAAAFTAMRRQSGPSTSPPPPFDRPVKPAPAPAEPTTAADVLDDEPGPTP